MSPTSELKPDLTVAERARLAMAWLNSVLVTKPLQFTAWLDNNQLLADIIIICSILLATQLTAVYEQYRYNVRAKELVDRYNQVYGTTYQVQTFGNRLLISGYGFPQSLSSPPIS